MAIDKAFYVRLQGRDFVLFAGLQDGASKAGLRSVVTTVVQLPTAENGRMAVMKARVEFEDGRLFEAIGDASPESVGRMIVPHLLRMAETRAVGRAYRWALNIGAVMKEELGEDEQATQPVGTERRDGRAAVVSHPPAERAPLPPSHDIAIRHAPECSICSVPLKPSVYEASMKRFERPFCVACGKAHLESQRAAAEAAAAD